MPCSIPPKFFATREWVMMLTRMPICWRILFRLRTVVMVAGFMCGILGGSYPHAVAADEDVVVGSKDDNGAAVSAEPVPDTSDVSSRNRPQDEPPKPLPPIDDQLVKLLAAGTALNPEQTAFLDRKNKRVLLRTYVVCPDCLLELLCCREGIRHHESILAYRGQASVLHAALLAVGAVPGEPVQYQPQFKPPSGHELELFVNWVDKSGELRRVDARNWMRHATHRYYSVPMPVLPKGIKVPVMELRYDPYNDELLWYGPMSEEQRQKLLAMSSDAAYQKAIHKFYKDGQSRQMAADFVFAGSYTLEKDLDGQTVRKYAAEPGGYVICVANFPQSTIDLREASSADDGGQSYEAWTERIPPADTSVVLEIRPVGKQMRETSAEVSSR